MPFRDAPPNPASALLRWALVFALHAGLAWLCVGLLAPSSPSVGQTRLTSVRLISATPPSPPPLPPRLIVLAPTRPSAAAPTTAAPQGSLAMVPEPAAMPATSVAAAAEPASGAASALALDAATISRAIRGTPPGLARLQARGIGKEDALLSPASDPMAEAIKKTERRDCRHAFGAAGLLAIIPLAISAVTDTGCRW